MNGILKLEYLLDQRFPDFLSATRATQQAIHFYNSERPHSSLGLQIPELVYAQTLGQEA
jgi:transposase InsO family protein